MDLAERTAAAAFRAKQANQVRSQSCLATALGIRIASAPTGVGIRVAYAPTALGIRIAYAPPTGFIVSHDSHRPNPTSLADSLEAGLRLSETGMRQDNLPAVREFLEV
jgi:hypothetical protein